MYDEAEAEVLLGHRFANYRGFAYMGEPEKVLHIIVGDYQFVPATNLPLSIVEALQAHDRDLGESTELRLERQSQLRCVASEIRYVHNGILRRLRDENEGLSARAHKMETALLEHEFALGDLKRHYDAMLQDLKRGETHNVATYEDAISPSPPLADTLDRCARDYVDMQARCAAAERQVEDMRDAEALGGERRQNALVLLHKAAQRLDYMLPSTKMLTADTDTAVSEYAKHNVLIYASVLESIHDALSSLSAEYNSYDV